MSKEEPPKRIPWGEQGESLADISIDMGARARPVNKPEIFKFIINGIQVSTQVADSTHDRVEIGGNHFLTPKGLGRIVLEALDREGKNLKIFNESTLFDIALKIKNKVVSDSEQATGEFPKVEP